MGFVDKWRDKLAHSLRERLKQPVSVVFPPMIRERKRELDPNYEGPIFIWDIDKTYLESNLDNMVEIIKIGLEKAQDKVNVPGTAVLLRRLKYGTGAGNAMYPVYFLTAGPPQIGAVFEEKLRMDGIECDGITFKNFSYYLLSFQATRLREHVGYKVAALLSNRLDFPKRSRELLFGDNSEQDPFIYSLYSDIVARRLSGGDLTERLREHRVLPEEIDLIHLLQDQLEPHDPVAAIYIHMARFASHASIDGLHPQLVATYNCFQKAVHLYGRGYLRIEDVLLVADNLREEYNFTRIELARSLLNLLRRELISGVLADEVIAALKGKAHLPEDLQRVGQDITIHAERIPLQDLLEPEAGG